MSQYPEGFYEWPPEMQDAYINEMIRIGHSPRVKITNNVYGTRGPSPRGPNGTPRGTRGPSPRGPNGIPRGTRGHSPRGPNGTPRGTRGPSPRGPNGTPRGTRGPSPRGPNGTPRGTRGPSPRKMDQLRKSAPKTWSQYLWHHSGKAAALAALIPIVAGIVMAGGPVAAASSIASTLSTTYGSSMATLFMNNATYVMDKVKSLANMGSTVMGYANTAAQVAHGASNVAHAAGEATAAVSGDEIDTTRLFGAMRQGTLGINALHGVKASHDASQHASLIARCNQLRGRGGPFSFEEQNDINMCDSMKAQAQINPYYT